MNLRNSEPGAVIVESALTSMLLLMTFRFRLVFFDALFLSQDAETVGET
jgi:hypothetical protein